MDDAVLSLGYRPDAFLEAYPDSRCAGVALHYAVEPEPLDTAGAIRFAALDAGIDDTFVVLNGDVLTDFDLGKLLARHAEAGAEGTIHLTPVDDPSRYGVVPTDDEGRVKAFIEKPPREIGPEPLDQRRHLRARAQRARPHPGGPQSLDRARDLPGDGRRGARSTRWSPTTTGSTPARRPPTCRPRSTSSTAGGPWRRRWHERTPPSSAGATVRHSVVMAGAVVEDGAVVVDSVVLPGARIESGGEVTGSIIGPGAVVEEGAVVTGLSIVGDDAVVEAGEVLDGERRPDEEGALMKALVTGGAGFIGSTLVDRLLAEGHQVDVVDNLSSGNLANLADARASAGHEVNFHQIDIRDAGLGELMARQAPEVVFHLAAQADVRVSVARPVFDAEVNVVGSLNVLEGARAAGARKVVFASSGGTIYGEPDPSELPVKESHPQQPLSPYGVAKKVVGDYLYAYRALHDLEYTALALANVYGPRQDPHGEAGVVAIFTGRLLAGEPCTIFGSGEQTRDFVYVDDVVDAFVRAADRGSGLLANIGTGREVSVNELYTTMAAAAGVTRPAGAGAAPRRRARQRSALDPGRAEAPPRLEALDHPRGRHPAGHRLVPRPRLMRVAERVCGLSAPPAAGTGRPSGRGPRRGSAPPRRALNPSGTSCGRRRGPRPQGRRRTCP